MRRHPNLVLIITDHTNAEAVAPGSPCLKPHLDALASEGIRFHRCHTPNAICSPARASLMTGLFPSTHGIWDCTHTQPRGWVDMEPGEFPFFSERLVEVGYRTGYFGKWHVESSGCLDRFGWQEYDVAVSHLEGREAADAPRVVLKTPGYRDYAICSEMEDDPRRPLPAHPAFEKGIGFIRRCASEGVPFCCVVSTDEPHDPYQPLQRFLQCYDLSSIPLPSTLRDRGEGKPEIVRRMQRVWRDLSDDAWRRIRASYWAVISYLDHEVGRLMAALRETGVWDDTIVLFTSDHGDMVGSHGLSTKGVGTAYEPVYNIPLIIRVPGGPRGTEERMTEVNTVDLAPTLLDFCGAAPLERMHGRSLRPLFEGGKLEPGENYAEFYGQRFVYTQRIVWCGDWKYVFNPGGCDELYNLRDDPHESVNRAEDAACREVLLDMVRRMWRRMRTIGDHSLLRTSYPTLRTAPVGPLAEESALS